MKTHTTLAFCLFALTLLVLSFFPTTHPAQAQGGAPFNGAPKSLPGTIEVEHFDNGGQGSGYYDTTAGSHGQDYDQSGYPVPSFRQPTDVDIYKQSAVYSGEYLIVGQAGDWLNYTVDVATAGTYTLAARVAWGGAVGGTFRVEVDGVNKTGSIQIPDTAWGLQTITKKGVYLPAGRHVLRLVWETNAANGYTGDIDSLSFTLEAAQPPAVVWQKAEGVSVSGGSLTKTAAEGWFNAGASSAQSIPSGDGYFEFTAPNVSARMAGLSNGDSNLSYTDIDFAIQPNAGGMVEIWESGTFKWGGAVSYQAGDRFRVAVEGGAVKYYKISGGVTAHLYTSAVAPTYPLLADASLYYTGAQIGDAVITAPQQTLLWQNVEGVTVNGSSLTKTAAEGWFNAGASSVQALSAGDGFMEFTVTNKSARMAGLSSDDSNRSYTDIDFAIQPSAAGMIEIWESGVFKWGGSVSYQIGDRFRVAVEGGVVKYYKQTGEQSLLLYVSSVAPTYPLRVDTSLYYTGATLSDVYISGENLALGRPATQSSDTVGGVASRAVDGNTSGNWYESSVTHTQPDHQAWWQVDLGSPRHLSQIRVWNRTDCCSERLSNFYVIVSDSPFASNDLATTLNQPGVTGYHTAGQGGTPTVVNVNRSGQYVRVQLAGTNYLSLAEVQVFGLPTKPSVKKGDLALTLNGAGQYIQVPHSENLNITGPFTVEAWIKTNANTTQQGIAERYNWTGTDADGGYGIRLTNQGRLQVFTVQVAGVSDSLEGGTVVSAGEWHHVAGVFDGQQLRVYLDGRLDGSKSSTLAPGRGTGKLTIGARGDVDSAPASAALSFNGSIDDVVLSEGARYTDDFARGKVVRHDGAQLASQTRGWWDFNEGLTHDCSWKNSAATSVALADVQSEGAMYQASAARSVFIGFDELPTNDFIPPRYYQDAHFWTSSDAYNYTARAFFSSPPNLLTRVHYLSRNEYVKDRPLLVEFPKPVNNLWLRVLEISQWKPVALLKVVYNNGNSERTYELRGCSEMYPVCDKDINFDEPNIKSLLIHTIQDPTGLNFDNFYFEVAEPTPTPTPTPEVTNVAFEPRYVGQLTGNPNRGLGDRIFPDKQLSDMQNPSTAVDRAVIGVRADSTYPANTRIYFRSFDVDDPSTDDPPVDPNGGSGGDNKGAQGGGQGTFNVSSALTDSSGRARVEFTTTKQPGDNFRIAASADLNYLNSLVVRGTEITESGGTVLPTTRAKAGGMLTVWRRLHIESDSMAQVRDNKFTGTVAGINRYELTTKDPSCIEKDKNATNTCYDPTRHEVVVSAPNPDPFRFQSFRSRLVVDGVSYEVIFSNTNTILISTPTKVPPRVGAPFVLYDDDDFNGDDGSTRDGDEGEEIPDPDTSLLQDSDDPARNVFAPAYVRPAYDLGSDGAVRFALNYASDSATDVRANYAFNNVAWEASPDFWTVYLLNAYQPEPFDDGDHGGDLTLGIVDSLSLNGWGANVFLETFAEFHRNAAENNSSYPLATRAWVAAHEVGHLFDARHDDYVDPNHPTPNAGIMQGSPSLLTQLSFTNVSLDKIRRALHP